MRIYLNISFFQGLFDQNHRREGHLLLEIFLAIKQMPGRQDCYTIFQYTDFTVPLLYDFPLTNYLADTSGDNIFLPLHLARLVIVSYFGASG